MHWFSTARCKLMLDIPCDRLTAAELLCEARRYRRRLSCRNWERAVELAAAFALQEAEVAESPSRQEALTHIADMMVYATSARLTQ